MYIYIFSSQYTPDSHHKKQSTYQSGNSASPEEMSAATNSDSSTMETTVMTSSDPPVEETTILIAPDTDLRDGDWVIALLILAAIGILFVVAFEIYLLYKMAGKEIRSMWLGQMLLLGLFLSFLSLFAFAPTPTKGTCGIIRFSIGFCYAVIYSVFLVKLMILFSSKTIGYLKGIFQVLMFIFALGVQLAIDIEWLIMKPPEAMVVSSNGKAAWVCSHTFSSHVTTLSYIMFLIVICTVLAFKSINIVTNHRESLYIAICSFLSILIFLTWILLGMLNDNKEFEDPCLAFGLLVTAMLVLLIMFSPKVHQLKKMKDDEPFIRDDHMEYSGNIASNTIHIETVGEPNGMVYAPPSYKSNSVSPPIVYVDDVDSPIYSEAYTKSHHLHVETNPGKHIIMSTPLGGGYIIFAFFAVRCPLSDVRRPASDVRRHAWFPLI